MEDALAEKEEYKELYDELIETCDNLLKAKSNLNSYSSESYYNDNNSQYYSNNYKSAYTIPSTLSTEYFDGGYLIKPSFENLHSLINMTNNEFISKMSSNNYVLTTDKESYICNDTPNCCYTIDKGKDFVSMIFTKVMQSNIEKIMSDSNINYNYKEGYKKYNYRLNSQSYELNIKSDYHGLIVVLNKI